MSIIDRLLSRLSAFFGSGKRPATVAAKSHADTFSIAPKPKPVTRFEPNMPVLSIDRSAKILISVVLIVYKMPEQARKTLISLSPTYQLGVTAEDYEIIVVENASDQLLGETTALAQAPNIRYFLRDEKLPTPVFAINFGAAQARGTHIAVMIDGARMCSPGIISAMLAATRLAASPVVAVPGYHLGAEPQQFSMLKGYNEAVEASLLDSIQWPADGYRLFDISCLSGTSRGGVFKPIGESNCLATTRDLFDAVGGYDIAFESRGGGFVNLDFYKRVVEHPDAQLILLLGEGSFHQIHGGATTTAKLASRDEEIKTYAEEYRKLRGSAFSPPEKRAIFFGALPDAALKFIEHGARTVINENHLKQ